MSNPTPKEVREVLHGLNELIKDFTTCLLAGEYPFHESREKLIRDIETMKAARKKLGAKNPTQQDYARAKRLYERLSGL